MNSRRQSYSVSFQMQQEADIRDQLGLEGIQSVQRKHEHRDFHCALRPERRNISTYTFEFGSLPNTSTRENTWTVSNLQKFKSNTSDG